MTSAGPRRSGLGQGAGSAGAGGGVTSAGLRRSGLGQGVQGLVDKLVQIKNFDHFQGKHTRLKMLLDPLTKNIYSLCYFGNWKYSSISLIRLSDFYMLHSKCAFSSNMIVSN